MAQANRRPRASHPRRRHTDRHGTPAPAPILSALCEAGPLSCGLCRGEVHSLLHPVGTRCECPCHSQRIYQGGEAA
jgi:hypothetical protein